MYFDIEIWISPNTHKRENKLNRITIFANKNLVGFMVEDGSMQIANITLFVTSHDKMNYFVRA